MLGSLLTSVAKGQFVLTMRTVGRMSAKCDLSSIQFIELFREQTSNRDHEPTSAQFLRASVSKSLEENRAVRKTK